MSATPEIPPPADRPAVPDTAPGLPPAPPDPQQEELRRLIAAEVREFGPRKYQAFYTKAKQLLGDLRPDAVRKDLIGEPPVPPPVPEGGLHFITRMNHAKKMAFYHVVRHAVEDALARRPPQFREEYGTAG